MGGGGEWSKKTTKHDENVFSPRLTFLPWGGGGGSSAKNIPDLPSAACLRDKFKSWQFGTQWSNYSYIYTKWLLEIDWRKRVQISGNFLQRKTYLPTSGPASIALWEKQERKFRSWIGGAKSRKAKNIELQFRRNLKWYCSCTIKGLTNRLIN